VLVARIGDHGDVMGDRGKLRNVECGFSPWPSVVWAIVWIGAFLFIAAGTVVAFVQLLDEQPIVLFAAFVPLGLLSVSVCLYVAWLLLTGLPDVACRRVRVCSDGIVLDCRGRTGWRWAEIERFAVGPVEHDNEETAYVGGLVLLRNGQRIDIPALQRSSFFGRPYRHIVAIRKRIEIR
jgi:hypothetical protein